MAGAVGRETGEMDTRMLDLVEKGRDLRLLAKEERKCMKTARHVSAQNLIQAHYARISTARATQPKTTGLLIPAKHRRLQTTLYEPMRSSRSKSQYVFSLVPSGSPIPPLTLPTAATPEGTKTVRFKLEEDGKFVTRTHSECVLPRPSSRLNLSKQDNLLGIKESCRITHTGVKREKRVMRLKRRTLLRSLKQCSAAVERALKVDVHGYVPKQLLEYKRKKAEERAARGIVLHRPPPIYLQKEVVIEYRRDLLSKALKHNIDKDLRYIYTLGTCSTTNT